VLFIGRPGGKHQNITLQNAGHASNERVWIHDRVSTSLTSKITRTSRLETAQVIRGMEMLMKSSLVATLDRKPAQARLERLAEGPVRRV
jgi:phage tail tape-measure protein